MKESKTEEPEEGLTLIAIEPTRDVVSEVYERLDKNLSAVRSAQNRPLTLADKILLSHLDDPTTTGMVRGQTYVQLRPDRVIFAGRAGPDGYAPVHADPPRHYCGAYLGALRPSDTSPGGGQPRSHRVAGGKRRGLQLPAHRLRQVRRRLLVAGRGHYPPSGLRELRLSPAR